MFSINISCVFLVYVEEGHDVPESLCVSVFVARFVSFLHSSVETGQADQSGEVVCVRATVVRGIIF